MNTPETVAVEEGESSVPDAGKTSALDDGENFALAEGEKIALEGGGNKLIVAAFLLLSAVYLLQLVSPLRLSPDAIVYLSMAASAAEGNGFLHQGQVTQFPAGYPLMLLALEKAGAGASWGFIGLNCVFLALGLAASRGVLREGLGLTRQSAALVCCLTLLSFVVIHHTLLAMSDVVFFGMAMSCVWLLLRARRRRGLEFWLRVAAAACLTAACIAVRTAGIVLVPALVWACLPPGRNLRALLSPVSKNRPALVMLAAAACAALVAAGVVLFNTLYFRAVREIFGEVGLSVLELIAKFRAAEWAELVGNMPVATMPPPLRVVFKVSGAVGLACVLYGVWSRRRQWGLPEVYGLSVTLIVIAWPFTDGRFWLPVLPLLMGWFALCMKAAARRFPASRIVLRVYLFWFVLAGLISLGLNTQKSLSNPSYADLSPHTLSVVMRYAR